MLNKTDVPLAGGRLCYLEKLLVYICMYKNSCPDARTARSPKAVKDSVVFDSRRIKMWTVNHEISNISKRSAESKTLWSE